MGIHLGKIRFVTDGFRFHNEKGPGKWPLLARANQLDDCWHIRLGGSQANHEPTVIWAHVLVGQVERQIRGDRRFDFTEGFLNLEAQLVAAPSKSDAGGGHGKSFSRKLAG